MKRKAAIAALSLAVISLTVAKGMGATPSGQPSAHKDGYIVVMKDGDKAPATFSSGHSHIDITASYGAAIHGFSAKLTTDQLNDLRKDPAVAYVQRDGVGHADGQKIPTGVSRIRALDNKALKTGDGKDQRVDANIAILDTGVADHSDLNVVKRVNCSHVDRCVEDAGNDDDGHGTNVAGIAAERDNNEGYVGVAPGARITSIKTLDDQGSGSTSELVGALDWVTAHASTIDVVNISAGYSGDTRAITDAVNRAIAKGVVVVVSAGNDHQDARKQSPANIPDAITVSSLSDGDGKPGGQGGFGWCNKNNKNKDDTLSDFSNFGPGIDIAAPGDCIQATGSDGGYSNYSGTSQAAPHVTGAAALIISGSAKPKDRAGVLAVRDKLRANGQDNWTDTSHDGVKEPLLDIHNSAVFKPAFADGDAPPQPGEPTPSGQPTPPGGPTPSGEPTSPGDPTGFGRISTSCDFSSTTCGFDASALGGANSTYTWDFGDGAKATGVKVTHTFSKKLGTYAPTVTYTDRNGKTVTAAATVNCADFYGPFCYAY
ncbi:S8 family serine peptidase [Streptomyces sp. NPDC051976]|uniref:S8 family serine peptidase n=1 Tax=Streptomyces sp. NPDC051976 TaxID=3154947 RepID=UPI0034246348